MCKGCASLTLVHQALIVETTTIAVTTDFVTLHLFSDISTSVAPHLFTHRHPTAVAHGPTTLGAAHRHRSDRLGRGLPRRSALGQGLLSAAVLHGAAHGPKLTATVGATKTSGKTEEKKWGEGDFRLQILDGFLVVLPWS